MKKTLFILLLLVACFTGNAQELSFADPLGSHMVIQQNKPFKVWGKAKPNAKVTVFADWLQSPVEVKADDAGSFLAIVSVPEIAKGDFTEHQLIIESNGEKQSLTDILIGEVWICSGQSNMQFGMDEVINSAEEVSKANFPNIRLFYAGLNFSNEPIENVDGEWKVCNTESVYKFSAVGYYFGKELFEELNVPVGIVFTGIGASAAQAYVPKAVLAADDLLNDKYLQPYLRSSKSKEVIDGGFSFEKVIMPFLLYNALIHPFKNLSISGFCWYQGESNRNERTAYTHLMHTMISSWREAFAQGDLPFYFVQIAPYFYDIEDPKRAEFAFFREAQEKISSVANTEMVVTMDVGNAIDLHPKNKKPIGIRLGKTALNRHYGLQNISYEGPIFDSVDFNGAKALLSFKPSSVKSGLKTNDGQPPKFFQLAGEDQIFYEAEAKIVSNKIQLSSSEVSKPVAVRYAFTNYPVTNLENGEGIPAVPFRTDDWQEPPVK
ncbi:MAG: sialate O-acetylesterase [Thalassobius sp.]|nr:sialate O-acetylesterase [Thalassovita sp.]